MRRPALTWPSAWSEPGKEHHVAIGRDSAREPRQPVVVIACRVLQDMLERLLPASLAAAVTLMDYGLHRVPGKLTWTLQEAIDRLDTPSLVMLGYGLCGNGLAGLQARRHTLLVPRSDDCIAILLGSYRAYMREFQAVPGTYYLTKGWLESGSNPLKEYEELVPKYGAKEAMWLMDQQYQNYSRVALVAHTQADLDQYRPQAQAVARFCERWGCVTRKSSAPTTLCSAWSRRPRRSPRGRRSRTGWAVISSSFNPAAKSSSSCLCARGRGPSQNNTHSSL